MDQQIFKVCIATQSPEKFLCLNEECYLVEKKQVQCYQCLTKSHLAKNKVVRHVDEFIELDKFLGEIKKKYDKKQSAISNAIQQAIDFQKEKLREIQLSKNIELVQLTTQKIETEISKFIELLQEQFLSFQFTFPYTASQHLQFIKFYKQNLDTEIGEAKAKLKSTMSNVEQFILSMDLDLRVVIKRLSEQQLFIEKQVSSYEKQFKYHKIQLFFLVLIVPYILFLHYNQLEIFRQIHISDRSRDIVYLQRQIEDQKILRESDQNEQLPIIINHSDKLTVLNTSLLETNDLVEKIKVRFDVYKKSSSQALQTIQENIKETTRQINEYNQQNQEQLKNFNLKLSIVQKDQFDRLNVSSRIQSLEQNQQLLNQKTINLEKQLTIYLQHLNLKQKEELLEKTQMQRQRKQELLKLKSDLIGKIHLNLTLDMLSDFELIYDQYFARPLQLFQMMKIQSKVFFEDGADPIVCIGGINMNYSNYLAVSACDFATEIFFPTFSQEQARKSSNGDDLYWYMAQEYSFGFAPNEKILLLMCDDWDEQDEKRLSIWYNLDSGGRRIGKDLYLIDSKSHKLQFYMLK